MLDKRSTNLLEALIYPIQFEQQPNDGIDWVLDRIVRRGTLGGTPGEYLGAIKKGLAGSEPLSSLIPQDHPEAVIRAYLREVQHRLEQGPLPPRRQTNTTA